MSAFDWVAIVIGPSGGIQMVFHFVLFKFFLIYGRGWGID
jgi:hypothetical protein